MIGVIYVADEQKNKLPDKVLNLIESLIPLIGEALYRFSVEEESRVMQDQLRNLTAHLQEVREEERTTIAREIHDELGQILTALKMNLSWISGQYNDHGVLAEKTKGMISLVDATIQRVKRITTELRPGILDHLGITAAIEWQASEFKKLTGISCDVDIPNEIILPRDQSTQIFRIFEETLTNIIRHAEATQVNVRFTDKGDTVVLAVKDNGKGITEAQLQSPGSFGLIGIRERIHSLGGEIIITGSPGSGTEVSVEVPKKKSEPSAEKTEM
jgi:signal transduction histidine kinase